MSMASRFRWFAFWGASALLLGACAVEGGDTRIELDLRLLHRDGSVRTWQSHDNPDVVRSAGPIDPEIGLPPRYLGQF